MPKKPSDAAPAIKHRKLVVQDIPCHKIKQNPYNPNTQTPRDFLLLLLSIAEEGFDQPIPINRTTYEIVDGEHRWRAWVALHYLVRKNLWKGNDTAKDDVADARANTTTLAGQMPDLTIPAVLVDMTPEQMRIATLRRNRARGTEDINRLASVFKELEELADLKWVGRSLLMKDDEIKALQASAAQLLGGDGYSEAWEPEKDESSGGGGGDDKATGTDPTDARTKRRKQVAETPDATKAIETGRGKRDLFRLQLVFSGEEAEDVRSVLSGPQAATMVLEWCRSMIPKEGAEEEVVVEEGTEVS